MLNMTSMQIHLPIWKTIMRLHGCWFYPRLFYVISPFLLNVDFADAKCCVLARNLPYKRIIVAPSASDNFWSGDVTFFVDSLKEWKSSTKLAFWLSGLRNSWGFEQLLTQCFEGPFYMQLKFPCLYMCSDTMWKFLSLESYYSNWYHLFYLLNKLNKLLAVS